MSDDASDSTEDLVRFFHALPGETRREIERLAEADRAFGEDVARERGVRHEGKGSS